MAAIRVRCQLQLKTKRARIMNDASISHNESSPLSFIPVIYIKLDGGHVGFCHYGGPIVLN